MDVSCESCGNVFDVPDSLVGGIANCPGCGRAVEVSGLRDPLWRLAQVVFAVGWATVTTVVILIAGPAIGIAAGILLAGLIWLASRAL